MRIRQKNRKIMTILTAVIFTAGMGIAAPEPAMAGKKTKNVILGIAAGAAGLAILHSLTKKKKRAAQPAPPVYYAPPRRYKPRPRRPRYYAPRPRRPRAVFSQETMQIQQSLAALGYNVGTADGLMGRSTRAGVRQFQISMGQPASGYLSPSQKGILFQRARGGVAAPVGYPVAPRPVVPTYQPPVYMPYTGRPGAPVYTPAAVPPTPYRPPVYAPYAGQPAIPGYVPVRPGVPAYTPPVVRSYQPGGYAPPRR